MILFLKGRVIQKVKISVMTLPAPALIAGRDWVTHGDLQQSRQEDAILAPRFKPLGAKRPLGACRLRQGRDASGQAPDSLSYSVTPSFLTSSITAGSTTGTTAFSFSAASFSGIAKVPGTTVTKPWILAMG